MTENVNDQMVKVPLPQYLEQVAERAGRTAAEHVLIEHIRTCPYRLSLARVIGFCAGISVVCSGVAFVIGKLWH